MARGRTRDLDARDRILEATSELLSAGDHADVRIDDIATQAGVGKQTIYRWWPSRTALVIDALLQSSLDATPFPCTGDAQRDFRTHLRAVARLFASPSGRLIRDVVGEVQRDAAVAAEFTERFWDPRRALSRGALTMAINRGEVRGDVDVEFALDLLYGPLWARLLLGHQPITTRLADRIVDAVWPQLATPTS
jgi:AcrR family transcriptional regulator